MEWGTTPSSFRWENLKPRVSHFRPRVGIWCKFLVLSLNLFYCIRLSSIVSNCSFSYFRWKYSQRCFCRSVALRTTSCSILPGSMSEDSVNYGLKMFPKTIALALKIQTSFPPCHSVSSSTAWWRHAHHLDSCRQWVILQQCIREHVQTLCHLTERWELCGCWYLQGPGNSSLFDNSGQALTNLDAKPPVPSPSPLQHHGWSPEADLRQWEVCFIMHQIFKE